MPSHGQADARGRDGGVHEELAVGITVMMTMFRRRSTYLDQKPTRPLPTTDGGTPRTVLDARAYMIALLKRRELRGQWQRACELLLTEANVGELTKAVGLVLFYDFKLDLTVKG
jgi:hypothetical protein